VILQDFYTGYFNSKVQFPVFKEKKILKKDFWRKKG